MTNSIIYQIGRLDTNSFKELTFNINGEVFNASLSSFAIKDYHSKHHEKSSTILIYPVSLPFNQLLLKNQNFIASIPQIFFEKIQNALDNPEEYLQNPYPLFESHPHSSQADDFFLIHSLGTYRTNKQQISFTCNYSDILLEIFFDMIERYLKYIEAEVYEPIKFVIDISSGLNIYVSALVEAARQFSVWLQLSGWHNREKIPEIILAFSDPILPGDDIIYSINFDPLKTKALFLSPINSKDIEHFNLSRAIYPNIRNEKRRLQEIFEKFLVSYSAIKNNIPLGIYQFGYVEKGAVVEVLKNLIEKTRLELYETFISSPDFNKDNYLKTLLTLGLCYGITSILEYFKIYTQGSSGIKIDELRESFKGIYNKLGLSLNDVILGNEVDKLYKALKQKEYELQGEWKNLFYLLSYDDTQDKEPNPQKRNFFAHAGFELNVTQYKVENDTLMLRYEEKYIKLIKQWLIESV